MSTEVYPEPAKAMDVIKYSSVPRKSPKAEKYICEIDTMPMLGTASSPPALQETLLSRTQTAVPSYSFSSFINEHKNTKAP